MNKEKQKILVICGPTASGKTSLALQLAKELTKANILSVDSRQIYKQLDIVTGKDKPTDLPKNIKIYGQDIFDPNERANLADFIRYSQKIINDSIMTKTPLIIVGGTGLYLKALTEDLSNISIPPNWTLRQSLEILPLEKLQSLLNEKNPDKYSSLNRSDFMNPRRLIRYLEITDSKIINPSIIRQRDDINFKWIGLLPGKEIIKEKIKNRVLDRLKKGALDEVKLLRKNFPDKKLTIYSSLGVSQIIDYLDKKISKEKLVEIWTNAEVDYARRQIVWFKKQPGIVWYDKSNDINSLICELKKIYQQNA